MKNITQLAGKWLLAMIVVVCPFYTAIGQITYVDANATGANNGTSWVNAYKYLQDALPGEEVSGYNIWVAQGTYKPDESAWYEGGTGDKNATFRLTNGVALYGGFPSGGGNWSSRDPNLHQTILSGDISGESGNSYHVVTTYNVSSTAILDGFIITAGSANGGETASEGGGMLNYHSSPTVTNCIFIDNSADDGGGIYNYSSSPILTNCTFTDNSAAYEGGGMVNDFSSPTVTSCKFTGNWAYFDGGGVFNWGGSPTFTNCTFSGNSTSNDYGSGSGGGMASYNSSPAVTNCTFTSNSSDYGGGMRNNSSSPIVTNCTFSSNSADIGGGMCNGPVASSPIVTNCTFSSNSAVDGGGGIYNEGGSSILTNCTFSGNSSPPDFGSGMYVYNSVIRLGPGGSNSTADEFYFTDNSQIRGTGSLVIGLGGKMIIDSDVVADLSDPNVPEGTGTIQCNGLLDVRGNGQLKHAMIGVNRQAGGYFGKFMVEDSATVTNLDIFANGDRYMDVDPCTFTGVIANNRIYVTITESDGSLEVRGRDFNVPPCPN
jgi:hypothetical protein